MPNGPNEIKSGEGSGRTVSQPDNSPAILLKTDSRRIHMKRRTHQQRRADRRRSETMSQALYNMFTELCRWISQGDMTAYDFLNDPVKYYDSRIMGGYRNNKIISRHIERLITKEYAT